MVHFRSNLTAARTLRGTLSAGLVVAVASLFGCYTEGGNHMSMDRFTYASTSWQPKTITLVDTRTGESIWSIDVPVGQRLSMQFIEGKNKQDQYRSAVMRWDLAPGDTIFGSLKNQMAVPDKSVRRVEMKLRPAPEMPTVAATEPPEYVPEGFGGQPDMEKGNMDGHFREVRKPAPGAAPASGPASAKLNGAGAPAPAASPAATPATEPAKEPPVPLPE